MNYKIFESTDTNVKKFVFEFDKSKAIAETVLYRYGSYKARTVICCSVQSGCKVGCKFCGTGQFFVRDLMHNEIEEQISTVLSTIDCNTSEIEKFQIMFMSMGEPFHNYTSLTTAMHNLSVRYPNAQLLVSTSAPQGIDGNWSNFVNFSREYPQVGIQFSVHESTDENRAKLIPTPTPTEQRPLRPSECIHYWGIHCTYAKHKGKECPIAHFSHCLDFTPKTEKDGKI